MDRRAVVQFHPSFAIILLLTGCMYIGCAIVTWLRDSYEAVSELYGVCSMYRKRVVLLVSP